MPLTLEELETEALQLPPRSRVELASRLMESVDADAAQDAAVERAWINEALRRRDDVHQGRTKTVSAEVVFAEVREALR